MTMKVKSLAPWFGGKRTLGKEIAQQLGDHSQYFEPFCGSMAVLFAKEKSQKETVCDLHGDLINLAQVVQNLESAEILYERLQRTLFIEHLLEEAREKLIELSQEEITPENAIARAYWYFLASWMGRNGISGTNKIDYRLSVRWTNGGGSPTVRFRNATESIPPWHERLRNVSILCRDSFEILSKFEDSSSTAIYLDPPYMPESKTSSLDYLHSFQEDRSLRSDEDRHEQLAAILNEYKSARIVLSYYDCDRVRELYEGWTFIEKTVNKNLNSQAGRGGSRAKKAPEILIVNGPQY